MTVSVVVGLLISFGVVRIVKGILGVGARTPRPDPIWRRALTARSAAALAAAALAGALTGWPVAGLIAAVAAFSVPGIVESRRDDVRREARAEAIGTWIGMVRDNVAAGAGVETAIRAIARPAEGIEPPQALAEELTELVGRLDRWMSLSLALRMFADEMEDEHADMAIMQLIRAAEHHSGRTVEQLTGIADGIDEELAGREGVTTERGKIRNELVAILLFLSLAGGFYFLFRRSYLDALATVPGEVDLLLAGVMFGTGVALLLRMARPYRAVRLLTPIRQPGRHGAATEALQ